MRNAAILLVGALVGSPAAQAPAAEQPKTITIKATPAVLPVGTYCSVMSLHGERSRTNFHGHVAEASQEGVRLSAIMIESWSESPPPTWLRLLRLDGVTRVPYINRYFRNVGIGRSYEKKVVWIPIARISHVEVLNKSVEEEDLRQCCEGEVLALMEEVEESMAQPMPEFSPLDECCQCINDESTVSGWEEACLRWSGRLCRDRRLERIISRTGLRSGAVVSSAALLFIRATE